MIRDFIFHYGIPFYNLAYESINSIYSEIVFTYTNIIKGYNSRILYFYDKNHNVYLESFIDSTNKLNGTIIWTFDMSKWVFFSYKCLQKDMKYLPLLSGIVTLHDKQVLDLTDFLTSLRI